MIELFRAESGNSIMTIDYNDGSIEKSEGISINLIEYRDCAGIYLSKEEIMDMINSILDKLNSVL